MLDVATIIGDKEQSDPALVFWLVEELMDSQTIAGCRTIFDYLESRRERMTARQFDAKKLVILRSCNELLRRLSRAEDTAFCGRVFIYMFQSFPLGDKSSVNLRGEYHVENITTYDEKPAAAVLGSEMDIDTDPEAAAPKQEATESTSQVTEGNGDTESKSIAFTSNNTAATITVDELYPIFWSLQRYFSQPKELFDHANFEKFRTGFDATIALFRTIPMEQQSKGANKSADELKTQKRKREDDDDEFAHTFNPKYLTSRDLFELEVKDLTFRRNILIQALIIMDFLLSLSAKAKEKLAEIEKPNISVMYKDQVLNDDDLKWVLSAKKSIAEYLSQWCDNGNGRFFLRMVESVLSRDKHWVRWKVESCPKIELPPLKPEDYTRSKQAIKRNSRKRQMRAAPMGSLDLSFLSNADSREGIERLKDPARYHTPELKSFKGPIMEDVLEIDMPTTEDSKIAAQFGKASKTWRALRIASKSKLALFDKIDDSETIDIIFEDEKKPVMEPEPEEDKSASKAAPEVAAEDIPEEGADNAASKGAVATDDQVVAAETTVVESAQELNDAKMEDDVKE